nr:uncharacterized protein CTRU02_09230 [Colletotrichum truncatum]KAF6788909.1 hypothetical protein CTRU02_09230 [Colletotrichum truncatum]
MAPAPMAGLVAVSPAALARSDPALCTSQRSGLAVLFAVQAPAEWSRRALQCETRVFSDGLKFSFSAATPSVSYNIFTD